MSNCKIRRCKGLRAIWHADEHAKLPNKPFKCDRLRAMNDRLWAINDRLWAINDRLRAMQRRALPLPRGWTLFEKRGGKGFYRCPFVQRNPWTHTLEQSIGCNSCELVETRIRPNRFLVFIVKQCVKLPVSRIAVHCEHNHLNIYYC